MDLPGIEELREQAETALAVHGGPRDPSFAYVDQEATRPSPLRTRPLIQAYTKRKGFEDLSVSSSRWTMRDGKFTPLGHDEWLEVLLPPSEFDRP